MNCIEEWKTAPHMQHRLQPWLLPQPASPYHSTRSQLIHLAEAFDPISLESMDDVALLNRVDTKFLMTTGQLVYALADLQPDYWMLQVNGQRLNHYRTLYFDTPNFDLYHAHVNDRPERYKVRSREYTDSHLSFLEVKHHTRKDRTVKERIHTAQPVVQITTTLDDWLQGVSPLHASLLEPKLWNTFTRLTLVSKQCCERVTLDIDLAFFKSGKRVLLDGIAIAEVKMDRSYQVSAFIAQMRKQKVCPKGFSKYAFGIAALYEQVKRNSMKPKMLWVEKIKKGSFHDEQSW